MRSRRHAADLRAVAKLAVDATTSVTEVVEEMHAVIGSGPAVLGRPLARPVGALTRLVYGHVRNVAGLVGTGVDVVLAQLDAVLGESVPGAERDAVVAALNGVLGDYLEQTGNPLAIPTELRVGGGAPEAATSATGKVLVLVHGSSMSDRQWRRAGHDHGAALARDLGVTPVYARYNSGLHISTNGRALAAELEARLGGAEEITLLGHSMGGLVARSACHAASLASHGWPAKLRRLVCLGSPHHGSPLERWGNVVDVLLGISAYSAPLARLGRVRSAGVTDLRYGNVLDEDWAERGRFALGRDTRHGLPLPEGVACYAVAGTTSKVPGEKLPGDGLVPVDSALGRHARPELTLAFPPEHQHVALGTGHLDLLGEAVYPTLRAWLA